MKKAFTDLRNTFNNIGFSEKETDVYFALLELGRGTVTEIARKAGINRTTAYDVLDKLVSEHLVLLSGKEPKQEYVIESPDNIRSFIEEKQRKLSSDLKELDRVIPELKSIKPEKERARIKFYEGEEGLRTVYEDTLTATEKILAYASVDDMHDTLPDYFPEYYKRRARKGIPIKVILPESDASKERTTHNEAELREAAFVPANEYYFSPEINIYDNKVLIASWQEKLGIIIESEEIADAMKKIFKLAWGEAKRIDQSH